MDIILNSQAAVWDQLPLLVRQLVLRAGLRERIVSVAVQAESSLLGDDWGREVSFALSDFQLASCNISCCKLSEMMPQETEAWNIKLSVTPCNSSGSLQWSSRVLLRGVSMICWGPPDLLPPFIE